MKILESRIQDERLASPKSTFFLILDLFIKNQEAREELLERTSRKSIQLTA